LTKRKIIFVFLSLLIALFILPKTTTQSSTNEEIHQPYYFKFGCLIVATEAPKYVYSEKTANITIKIEAYDAPVEIAIVNITIYGSKGDHKEFLKNLVPAQNQDLGISEKIENTTNLFVPNTVSGGKILGKAQFEWKTSLGGHISEYIILSEFVIAYVVDTNYQELQDKYAALNDAYNDLNRRYEELNNTCNDWIKRYNELNATYTELKNMHEAELDTLDTTRRLLSILAITTALFFFTTLYLYMKKPKQTW
jgi:peptidoglycan hydrolase CwlO-like protein